MISIKGLNKAEVLKTLYDHSHIQGMGFLQAVPDGTVTVEHCQMLLDSGYTDFDYLYGKVLKVNLSGDEFDERLYDRDCGPGAAARAVNSLREVDPESIRGQMFVDLSCDKIKVRHDYDKNAVLIRFDGLSTLESFIREATKLRLDMLRKLGATTDETAT